MVSSNNAITNTVGASISGVTNTLTVTNPSNTASSAARETIVVGGATASDPTINWNVSGVTNWEMGIDNSVSDNLTISQGTALGTNDTWRMDTTGRRTMPLQPCFSAYKSANQLNATGDGTVVTIVFDTEINDQSSNYNNATGIFTAPVNGTYFLCCAVGFNAVGAAHTLSNLNMVTTSNTYQGPNYRCSTVADTGGGLIYNLVVQAVMTAGDTARVQWSVSGGTKTININATGGGAGVRNTYFQGFLIC